MGSGTAKSPGTFTAADVQDTAGLSYRQLNDWEGKGVIPEDKQRGSKWRRFNLLEVFALLVCARLRDEFNIPVQKLGFAYRELSTRKYLSEAVDLMIYLEADAWLVTDLKKSMMLVSELSLDTHVTECLQQDAVVLLKLNEFVDRIREMLAASPIKVHGEVFENLRDLSRIDRVLNEQEKRVLSLVRSGKYKTIEITLANGKITTIKKSLVKDAESKIEDLLSENDYQTIKIVQNGGKVVLVQQDSTEKV